MGNFLHRTTLDYLVSTSPNDLTEPLANYVIDPDMSPVAGSPKKYWKLIGDDLFVMSQAEKDAVDAAELTAARDSSVQVEIDDLEAIDRQVVILSVGEFNEIRQWIMSFKAEVAAAGNLGQLQTGVAGLPDLPDITLAQAKTKIRNGLGS